MTRRSISSLIILGIAVGALFIGALVLGVQNVRQLEYDFQQTVHTRSVISELETVLSLAKDAETGQRGYIITGENRYLEPYNVAVGSIYTHVDELNRLMLDEPGQQENMIELNRRLSNRLRILNEVITVRDRAGLEAARESMLPDDGKREMDALRAITAAMVQQQEGILQQRSAASAARYRFAVVTGLIASLLALSAIAGFLLLMRRYLAARAKDALVITEQAERLRTTLASIGDAVITTDLNGRITNMNAVAESLTGWKNDEACGEPLETVFRIINEDSRLEVDNPALKALREGAIVGLANHTLLLAKDGVERPIDDSAAPIRSRLGEIVGCVLVFRDVSDRREVALAAAERSRLVALRADSSEALASGESMKEVLQSVCEAFVRHLDMAFARIWTLDAKSDVLELQASAGIYTHINGPHARVPVGEFKIGRIAASRQPHLTNAVADDPNVSDREWAKREGMTAFAGYPLTVNDQVIGVVAMFSRRPISEGVLADLAPLCGAIASFVDRRMTDRILRDSEARKTAMFETALDSIISIDHDGKIIEINAAAEETFGYRREEVLGREIAEVIIPPEFRESHRQGLAHMVATGEGPILNQRMELSALRSDGTEFPVELTVTQIALESQPLFTAYLRDITERKILEKMEADATNELRQLAADLSEADRRKTEFLAMLAHELRNPLAPIRNALQIMRLTGEGGHALRSASDMMERQVGQLVRLVDDLLDVSRITRGKIELRREQVEIGSVIQNAAEVARPSCDAGGVELVFTLPSSPIYLDGDAARLAQVMGNLLNNSCKFTNSGGRIDIAIETESRNAVITIKDTGIGIAENQLPHVFDMFVQADTSLERSTSGLGIGLTLVKKLVELHDGTVNVRSKGLGHGSEFVVRLPMVTSPNIGDATVKTGTISTQSNSPSRMVVVDDNVDSAESLAILMRISGHEVRIAHDGVEAVDAAAEFLPQIILMDIGLPKLNGYEAARRIRNLPTGADIVLIALTGWGQDDDRRKSKEAGFDAHIVKPVDHPQLLELLNTLNRGDRDPKASL